jgi:hypothetical protein
MLYRRNRYFDPVSGQFTQQDPIGTSGGMNLWGFASGDPVNYSDPFGLCPPDDRDWSTCTGFFTVMGAATGALIGGVSGATGGGVMCAATGPVAVVCATGGGAAGVARGALVGASVGATLDGLLLFAKKHDIGQIEDAAKRVGMTRDERRDFGKFVEEEKVRGRVGSANERGDFTFKELVRLAKEFIGHDQ